MQHLQVELALESLLLSNDTHCVLALPEGCWVLGGRLHDLGRFLSQLEQLGQPIPATRTIVRA